MTRDDDVLPPKIQLLVTNFLFSRASGICWHTGESMEVIPTWYCQGFC
jgi:hypothetical protein